MAGNQIRSLPADVIAKMHYVKKADFRMNDLTLPASEVREIAHLLVKNLNTHANVKFYYVQYWLFIRQK